MNGRRTSSVGFGAAAGYVSDQLRSYGLQPVHLGEFRHVGYGPINHAATASVIVLGQDTTRWEPDLELIPDPRTSTGRFRASGYRFIPAGGDIPPAAPGQVAILGGDWSTAAIQAVGAAGYPMALLAQNPAPGRESFSVEMGLIQVSSDRLASILSIVDIAPLLVEGGEGEVSLELATSAEYDPVAGLVNTLAYLPGADPFSSDRLVVMGVNLDSGGYPAGVALIDSSRSGIGAAATLEVARLLAHQADQGRGQDTTVLFAWFAGGAQGNTGVRAFLRNPVWPLNRVDAFFLVGSVKDEGSLARDTGGLVTWLGSDVLSTKATNSQIEDAGLELAAMIRRFVVRAANRTSKHDPGD